MDVHHKLIATDARSVFKLTKGGCADVAKIAFDQGLLFVGHAALLGGVSNITTPIRNPTFSPICQL